MNDRKFKDQQWRRLISDIKELVIDEIPVSAIDEPFICFDAKKRSGWVMGISLIDSEDKTKWFDPIKFMKASLEQGWEDEEMLRAIVGVKSLLRVMEKDYKKYGGKGRRENET